MEVALAVAELDGKVRRLLERHRLLGAELGEGREEVSGDDPWLGVCKNERGQREANEGTQGGDGPGECLSASYET